MTKHIAYTDQGRIQVDVTTAYAKLTIRQAAAILRRQLPALLREINRLKLIANRNRPR